MPFTGYKQINYIVFCYLLALPLYSPVRINGTAKVGMCVRVYVTVVPHGQMVKQKQSGKPFELEDLRLSKLDSVFWNRNRTLIKTTEPKFNHIKD